MTGRAVAGFTVWTLLIVGALVVGASYFGDSLAVPGAVGVAVVASAVLTASRRVAPPLPSLPSLPPPAEAGRRPFRRLFWLRERLIRGIRSGDDFRLSVVPVLVELADDRLRRRHAVDRRTEPHRARELLGDELADVLDGGTGARAPGLVQVGRFLDRIEQL
jgi:hypothetical protein